MPTMEQYQELAEKCELMWATRYGVGGYLFTGPNSNTLFLPAAGDHQGGSLYDEGNYGFYWSRTLNSNYPRYAFHPYFHWGGAYWYNGDRFEGFTVRAVRVSQN